MESMTGYGYIEGVAEQFSYSVEIKSLNSRYLETNVNLPRILRNEENLYHSVLKNSFSRGKVDLSIEIFDWVDVKPVSLNVELIKKYYNELFQIHDRLMIREPLQFESVLGLDGIAQRERSIISDKSQKDINKTMELVIKKTLEMRKKEGVATKKDIINSLSEITANTAEIKSAAKHIAKDKNDQLKKRIEALAGDKIDDVRLYSEIAILADKIDINEEIVRLTDHLKKFKAIMKDRDQIGKKLDFISQEMFREINTIVSKANSSEISHMGVEVKNHIDKIREQCRNIV